MSQTEICTQAGETELLVLGQHTLFALGERGAVRFQKRLDYDPSCCFAYPVPDSKESSKDKDATRFNLLVASHQRSLMVYSFPGLAWAARGGHVPVAIVAMTMQ
jgi:Bardet-Biedl syndrome 9 protein